MNRKQPLYFLPIWCIMINTCCLLIVFRHEIDHRFRKTNTFVGIRVNVNNNNYYVIFDNDSELMSFNRARAYS